jgi:hypothetical protein
LTLFSTGVLLAADTYRVSLSIPPAQNLPGPMLTYGDMTVLELPTSLPGVDVLIGLDVLLTCKLIVDGPGGHFTLDF